MPDVHSIIEKGNPSELSPYCLEDMANDVVGLLDLYGVKKAHVIGTEMGGMIAQIMAVNHPDRLLSQVPIMSSVSISEAHELG